MRMCGEIILEAMEKTFMLNVFEEENTDGCDVKKTVALEL